VKYKVQRFIHVSTGQVYSSGKVNIKLFFFFFCARDLELTSNLNHSRKRQLKTTKLSPGLTLPKPVLKLKRPFKAPLGKRLKTF